MQTPSKKVIYFLIVITTIVTGVISYNSYKNKVAANTNPQDKQEVDIEVGISIENNYTSQDTDGDGLFDWEEVLRGTDIRKIDSDGDGTKDGAEVALSRDPNYGGPDDDLTTNDYLEGYVATTNAAIDSVTSKIARNLLDEVTQEGVSSTEVADKLLLQIKKEIEVLDIYKKENLITFDASDKDQMQKYLNDLIKIPTEIGNQTLQIPIVTERNYAESYKKMAVRLSTIPVPNTITGLHADFINNFNIMAVFTDAITKSDEDPIKTLAIIPEFKKVSDEQTLLLEQIKNYMESNGIIFSTNE